ncbi:hypothetical protein FRX31_016638, partial [Thalictrum thalictroides]
MLEDIPRVLFIDERGYRFPIWVVLEEDELQKTVEHGNHSWVGGGGDRSTRNETNELSGKGENELVVLDAVKPGNSLQLKPMRGEQTDTPQSPHIPLGHEWDKATCRLKPTKLPVLKSWADVVKTNSFEALSAAVEEEQGPTPEVVKETPESSQSYFLKPKINKLGPAHSFNSSGP